MYAYTQMYTILHIYYHIQLCIYTLYIYICICILYVFYFIYIFSETSSVGTKKNPSRKQYGLSRLPVDRKQAYLQETAAPQQDQTLHSNISDQCEVEYDSDEDTGTINVPKTDPINVVKTETIDASNNNDSKLNNIHKEAKKLSNDDNSIDKLNNIKVTGKEDKLSVDSEPQPTDHDHVTKDSSKDVVSPKRTKMIGPSLGPLRKRRRRSSEVQYVHTYVCMYVCMYVRT